MSGIEDVVTIRVVHIGWNDKWISGMFYRNKRRFAVVNRGVFGSHFCWQSSSRTIERIGGTGKKNREPCLLVTKSNPPSGA